MFVRGEIKNRGKKHFSEPYLFANIDSGTFEIRLPHQLVREDCVDGLHWEITTGHRELSLEAETYLAVTAMKTEDLSVKITAAELFQNISIKLSCSSGTVRKFSGIAASPYRFFDMEGDASSRLFAIPMCAYTSSSDGVESAALIDKVRSGSLMRWDFSFEDGDIVVLPDQTAMTVGERFRDGFLPRNIVSTVSYSDKKGICQVYKAYPELLLTIPKTKVNGTVIEVNGSRMSLGKCSYRSFEVKDSAAEEAFLLPISQFQEIRDCSVNTIFLDVPGTKYDKLYRFCLIQGFSADFVDAPYVFDDHAVVTFPNAVTVYCNDSRVDTIRRENSLSLKLSPDMEHISIEVGDNHLPLLLNIPVLLWSVDKTTWQLSAMGELWHTSLPKKLYFKSPVNKLCLEADYDDGDDEDDDSHSVRADNGADGVLAVDMARFRSWLTRDKIAHNISLQLKHTQYPFAMVYTRSYVAAFSIDPLFDEKKIVVKADILGQSLFFIDVKNVATGEFVAEKVPVIDGNAAVSVERLSGSYHFEIFEAEEDDSGFDDYEYYSIYSYTEAIVDKSDLSGKNLHITQVYYRDMNQRFNLDADYWVVNLQKLSKGLYSGILQVGGNPQQRMVQITFQDPNNLKSCYIEFWEEEYEEYLPYIYDVREQIFVKDEPSAMARTIAYRRYRPLYAEEYDFIGELSDVVQPFSASKWTKQKSLPISRSTLDPEIRYALMDSGYMYLDELMDLSVQELQKIRNINFDQAKCLHRYFEEQKEAAIRKGADGI